MNSIEDNNENIQIKPEEKKIGNKEPMNQNSQSTVFGLSQNTLIVILILLIILALLGFNLLYFTGNVLEGFFVLIRKIVIDALQLVGYYTGATINVGAEVAGDTAKESIEIAEGTLQSVGNLLQNKDNMDSVPSLEQEEIRSNFFNYNPLINENATEAKITDEDNVRLQQLNNLDNSIIEKSNEIQSLDNEINLRKTIKYNLPSENYSPEQFKWCPIGKDKDGRKCVQVKNEDRCMYGTTFNNQEECENNMKPDFSGYKYNNKSVNWGVPPPPPPPGALTPPIMKNTYNQLPGMPMGQNSCSLPQMPFMQPPIQYPMYQPPLALPSNQILQMQQQQQIQQIQQPLKQIEQPLDRLEDRLEEQSKKEEEQLKQQEEQRKKLQQEREKIEQPLDRLQNRIERLQQQTQQGEQSNETSGNNTYNTRNTMIINTNSSLTPSTYAPAPAMYTPSPAPTPAPAPTTYAPTTYAPTTYAPTSAAPALAPVLAPVLTPTPTPRSRSRSRSRSAPAPAPAPAPPV
jgi:hypothetical protein